jgi:hypothetical protein
MKVLAIALMVCGLSIVLTGQDSDWYDPAHSGTELLRGLNDHGSGTQRFAVGYVIGIGEALTTLNPNQPSACVPKVSPLPYNAVKRYLDNHPEELRRRPPFELVVAAFREAFPCQKK